MNQKLKYQCVLCGYQVPENVEQPPKNCPDCNCSKFREVTKMQPADHPSPESIAHLTKKVVNCPNFDIGEAGQHMFHKLVLQRSIDYSKAKLSAEPKLNSVTIQERCSECRQLYTQRNVPLSRPDVLEKLGVLQEVEHKIGKLAAVPQ